MQFNKIICEINKKPALITSKQPTWVCLINISQIVHLDFSSSKLMFLKSMVLALNSFLSVLAKHLVGLLHVPTFYHKEMYAFF